MKLVHKDKEVAEVEGVIERSGIDAKEALATGNYVEVTDEPEKAKAEKPEKAKK